jgi:hypothetical protein
MVLSFLNISNSCRILEQRGHYTLLSAAKIENNSLQPMSVYCLAGSQTHQYRGQAAGKKLFSSLLVRGAATDAANMSKEPPSKS